MAQTGHATHADVFADIVTVECNGAVAQRMERSCPGGAAKTN